MLENMAVKTKILVLSILMIAIICIVAAVGIFFNAKAQDSLNEMYNSNLMATQYLNDANVHIRAIEVNVPYVLLLGNNSLDAKVLQDDIISRLDNISGDVEKLKLICKNESSQMLIARLEEHLSDVKAKIKDSETLVNSPEARIKLFEDLTSVNSVARDLASLTPDNVAQGKILFEDNNVQYDRSIKIFAFIILHSVTSFLITLG